VCRIKIKNDRTPAHRGGGAGKGHRDHASGIARLGRGQGNDRAFAAARF